MTAYAVAECIIFGVPTLFLAAIALSWLPRKYRERRQDREWASDIARRVRERADFEKWGQEFSSEGSERP